MESQILINAIQSTSHAGVSITHILRGLLQVAHMGLQDLTWDEACESAQQALSA